jgi:hypothetical protein
MKMGHEPMTRAQGSRLDPGELEEIELLVQRGEPVSHDQVLGLIETARALARRCAVRFNETLELREALRTAGYQDPGLKGRLQQISNVAVSWSFLMDEAGHDPADHSDALLSALREIRELSRY